MSLFGHNTKKSLFLSFSAIFLTIQSPHVAAIELCTTPDAQEGECVMINHCPHLFTLILNETSQTNHTHKDFLKKSYCGHIAQLFPKVCCAFDLSTNPEGRNLLPDPNSPKTCGISARQYNSNDEELALNSHPWAALIEYENMDGQRSFECGGILINDRYVLTAAHCVRNLKNSKIVGVRLGEYNTDSDPDCSPSTASCLQSPQNLQIAEIIPHELYNPSNHRADIALLRLKTTPTASDSSPIHPVCLPFSHRRADFTGEAMELGGWARFRAHHFMKNAGAALIWPHNKCQARYTNLKLSSEHHLCASQRNENERYPGDVGGVLLQPPNADGRGYSAVGILSRGLSGREGRRGEIQPRIYTKIGDYWVWIINNLKP